MDYVSLQHPTSADRCRTRHYMVTIEVDNSTSKINNLTSIPFNKLRKTLSYSPDSQAAFFAGGNYNRLRYCIDKQGIFNTGLLARVIDFLHKEHIEYDILDKRIAPIRKVNHKAQFKYKPYNWQLAAADALVVKKRGIVSASTGSGKSLVIALIASRLNVRTLVVVPSLQIKEQLIEAFKAIFGDMSNLTVENIDSGYLKTAKGYDCLIIDECHHSAAKTYQKLNKTAWAGIYYRAFLTATPFRNQTEETLLFEGIAGQVIYSLSYKEAVLNKFIVPIEAYYIEILKVKTDAYTWAEVYSQLVVNNEVRNDMLAWLLFSLNSQSKSTLCLVKEIRHGELLSEMTSIPFANGQDETTRHYIKQFADGKIKSLIGTTGVMGEGVDTKPCEYVIIAGLGKAKSALMQQIGRAVRTYPGKESGKVILIKDRSHKFLLRHFNTQASILKDEYGVALTKLEI